MKRFLFSSSLLLITFFADAQVGVGTIIPGATLDVTAAYPAGNTTGVDGILIPRVTRQRAQSMSTTNLQTSTIIYVTEAATGTAAGTTVNVTSAGFYYYNGSVWTALAGGASNAWNITGNAGILPASNYIGTSTNVDVPFRRNAVAAGRLGATSTSFGVAALQSGPGTNSTAFGSNALSASTGNNNTAVGANALRYCASTAQYNTAVGTNALQGINNAASQYNTALGAEAMGTTTGDISYCTAIGYQALNAVSGSGAARGLFNTALGYQAGNNITTGENNIAIGYQAVVPTATANGQIRIGNAGIGYAGVQVAWTVTSDRRWKGNIKDSPLGLDFIKTLRPVSYTRNNDIKGKTEYGFIAQEIETALIKAGDPNNAIISKDDNGMYGVRYNDFISISVKAIQEQQSQIEELKKKNEELTKVNESILKRLEALEKK